MRLRAGECVELPAAAVRLRLRYEPEEAPEVAGGAGGQGGGRAVLVAVPPEVPLPPGAFEGVRPGAGGVGDAGSTDSTLVVDLAPLTGAGGPLRVVLRGPRSTGAGLVLLLADGATDGPADASADPSYGGPQEDLARMECGGPAGDGEYVVAECAHYDGRWHFRAVLHPAHASPVPITLTRQAPTASLTLQGGTSGTLHAVPAWRPGPGAPAPAGIDLCALFELADGTRGVVQSLGGALGALDRPPFLRLGGDRRTGEHLDLNLDHAACFRRVLLFVSAYSGDLGLTGLHGSLTLRPEHGADVHIPLDPATAPAAACALALISRDGPHLVVHREARHLPPRPGLSPQRMVDYAYGWGLRWTPGHD